MINRIYIEAAIENSILNEVDDLLEYDDAAAHVQRSKAQKALSEVIAESSSCYLKCVAVLQSVDVAKHGGVCGSDSD